MFKFGMETAFSVNMYNKCARSTKFNIVYELNRNYDYLKIPTKTCTEWY